MRRELALLGALLALVACGETPAPDVDVQPGGEPGPTATEDRGADVSFAEQVWLKDTTTRDADGVITAPGRLNQGALRLGDCLLLPDSFEDLDYLAAVPCSEPHDVEIVFVDDQVFADSDAMPSEADREATADATCEEAVGKLAIGDDMYGWLDFYPTEMSWDQVDDRGVMCGYISLDDSGNVEVKTGSLLGD